MAFEFDIPRIVDIDGVDGSPYARDMQMLTEESREKNAAATDGKPIIDFEGTSNPYIDYESIDLLLSLQHPRSKGYDEMVFIIAGQAKELLFKALYFELYNLRRRVQEDDIDNAFVLIERCKRILKIIISFWDLLATITTDGFNEFRDYLDVASGQQSFMYRHVEFILGNKSESMCLAHKNVPHVYPGIRENFESTSLYDEAIRLLHRNGYEVAAECLERDWTEKYTPHQSVEDAWMKVYKNPSAENKCYLLGENLIEIADLVSQYRWRHFIGAERIIGFKKGTGGSTGVEFLQHVLSHRFFPELWTLRSKL